MAEETDWEKYHRLSKIPESERMDEQTTQLNEVRRSEYERLGSIPESEITEKQKNRFNQLSEEISLPDKYMLYRRKGPQTGLDETFNIVLPKDRALGKVIEEHSSSLCWANVWAYSPVDHWSSQKTKAMEPSKFAETSHRDDLRFEKEKMVGQYHILTSSENIEVTHSHNWEDGGIVTGAISSLGNLYAKITSFKSGQAISAQGVKIDKSSTYQESELPTITVPVALFTYDNPLQDIIIPITELVYFTYPMRISGGNLAKERKEGIIKKIEQEISDLGEIGENTVENLKTMFSAYRYVVPHTFALSFSNYTINLPKCVITDISVTYNGPWTRGKAMGRSRKTEKTNSSLLEQIMDGIERVGVDLFGKSGVFRGNWFPNEDIENPNMRKLYEKIKKYKFPQNVYENTGYPTYAELEITFQALEPIFAQDIYGTLPNSKVTVTESR